MEVEVKTIETSNDGVLGVVKGLLIQILPRLDSLLLNPLKPFSEFCNFLGIMGERVDDLLFPPPPEGGESSMGGASEVGDVMRVRSVSRAVPFCRGWGGRGSSSSCWCKRMETMK